MHESKLKKFKEINEDFKGKLWNLKEDMEKKEKD